jgi:hypothetical protein
VDVGDESQSVVKHMVVIELGRFLNALLEWNARLLGYNTSSQTISDHDYGRDIAYTQHRLKCCPSRGFRRSIPHVCAHRV